MTKIFRQLVLLGLALALSACAGFSEYRAEPSRGDASANVLALETVRGAPIEAGVFVLDSPEQAVVGAPQIVYTRETDTLSQIAREYGLGYDEIVAANPDVDPWLPGAGQPILLPTQFVLPSGPREGLVLNIASKRLFYYPPKGDDGTVTVITYPVGIGRVGWETPLGEASVVGKARDPHWWVPASVRREHEEIGDPLPSVVPPGPDNPLGRFVLQLDMPGYLIHGTNQPYGVGMRVSHGCVRLYPENIEALFPLVSLGAKVTIVNEPFLAGWYEDELYFEAHTPLADDELTPDDHLDRVVESLAEGLAGRQRETIRSNLESVASIGAGIPVRVLRNDVYEVYERARVVTNIVEPDPDVPTLAEVREMLDQPLDDGAERADETDNADVGAGGGAQ